jgi:hypothetical protein
MVKVKRKKKPMGTAYHKENVIQIDGWLGSRRYLETLIHMLLHLHFPALPESDLEKACLFLGQRIWRQGYRRVKK